MNLHTDIKNFRALITFASMHFNITPEFVEKDYWITLLLCRLAQSSHIENTVFKGGTSLSKGYRLINRFSEDIDIAMINENLSGNTLKTKIRNIEKEIAIGLTEIVEPGITSKGSMFRKSIFEYPTALSSRIDDRVPNRIIIEINSFANPYPYVKQRITSFITEFLVATNRVEAIERYGLRAFSLNVLDKRRTMIEKLVSLVRFSFSENPTQAIASKIRHFYDLYYLVNDVECAAYIQSPNFKADFQELLAHDRATFDMPEGWRIRDVEESLLMTDFPALWENLRITYRNELTQLSFVAIPDETDVANAISSLFHSLSLAYRKEDR